MELLEDASADTEVDNGINLHLAQRLHDVATFAANVFFGQLMVVTINLRRAPELYACVKHETDTFLGNGATDTYTEVRLERSGLDVSVDISVIVRLKQIVVKFNSHLIHSGKQSCLNIVVIFCKVKQQSVLLVISLDNL